VPGEDVPVGDDRGRDEDGGGIPGVGRRRALVGVGVALTLAAAAFGLVGRIADYGELVEAARRSNRLWLPVAAAGEVLAYVGYVVAYRAIARVDGGPRLPVWTAIRVVALGFGASVVGSSAGGLAVDFWALRHAGLKAHDAARRVLALNTMEWGVLAWFAALSAVAVLAGRGHGAPLGMTLGWIVLVPTCTALAAYVTQPRRLERLSALGGGRGRPGGFDPRAWALWLWEEAKRLFSDAVDGVQIVRVFVTRPHRHPGGIAGFPLYWIGDLVALYASLRAFDSSLHPTSLVLAYASAYVLTALPLPAGGAGSMEVVIALTLHAVGVALAPALLAAFLYRIFAFWLPILPALVLLPTVPRLLDDLPQTTE
jgi:uncharacterized membrane protein YbhN (UPF0104 family)